MAWLLLPPLLPLLLLRLGRRGPHKNLVSFPHPFPSEDQKPRACGRNLPTCLLPRRGAAAKRQNLPTYLPTYLNLPTGTDQTTKPAARACALRRERVRTIIFTAKKMFFA